MQYNVKFPKKVFSGQGSMSELKGIVQTLGASNVCLMTDAGVYGCGLADTPLSILKEAGAEVVLINDVPREPSVYDVKDLYAKLENANIQLIVAIGGGSVIDMAKMMSVAMTNDNLVDDIRAEGAIKNPSLPMVAIPTTSGTGAEATANAIFLFPEEDLKVGIVNEYMIPDYVILDVTTTCGLPAALTASTGVDALCHAVESYISTLSNPFCEMLSLKAVELICRSIEKAYADGSDLKAREDMQLGSFYAGLCLTTSSTVAVHALSYPLGGKYHIPHGVSNAILLPYVMDVNMECCQEQYTVLAPYMIPDINNYPKEQWPKMVVDYLYSLMKRLDIPDTLTGFGVKPEDIPLTASGYAGPCFSLGTTGGVLIMCLVFGHLGHIGKLSLEVKEKTLKVLREFGLAMFLIGAGFEGGVSLVQEISNAGGASIVIWGFVGGALMTLFPMIVGFVLGKYVLKLPLLNSLGSITGGMTSTPALGTLISTAETDDVASAYASTYPIALILIVLASQLMITLM